MLATGVFPCPTGVPLGMSSDLGKLLRGGGWGDCPRKGVHRGYGHSDAIWRHPPFTAAASRVLAKISDNSPNLGLDKVYP